MCHPSHSVAAYRDAVNAAAEREAAAEARLHDLLGTEAPTPLVRRRLEESIAAAALGLPEPQSFAFSRTKAVRAHLRLCQAYRTGRPFVPSPLPVTAAERRGHAQRRADRAARLAKLAAEIGPAPRFRPVKDAAALVGTGARLVLKYVAAGRVRARAVGRHPKKLVRLPGQRRWVTGPVAAAALNINPRTVLKLAASGRLEARTVGGAEVDVADLIRALAARPTWSAPRPRASRRADAAR